MARVPPFVLVVRVFVGGISELRHCISELVLAQSCKTEGQGFIVMVETEVHEPVHIEVDRRPRMQLEQVAEFPVALRSG